MSDPARGHAWLPPLSLPATLALGFALLAPAAPAAELVMRDLDASAAVLPTSFDFTLATPTFTSTGHDRFDAGTALELGGRYSFSRVGDPFGLVLGLDVRCDSYSYDSQDFLLALGARGSLGVGWAITDAWTVTAELGASYGRTRLSLPESDAAPAFTARGSYHGFDGRITGIYTITRRMLIYADAGYLDQSHRLTTDQGDRLTLDLKGPYLGIGMTWRFSNAPERVE